MPTSPIRDFLWLVFRAFFRIEATGLENIAKAGPNAIIALNHVSYLRRGARAFRSWTKTRCSPSITPLRNAGG